PLFPYTTLFRSKSARIQGVVAATGRQQTESRGLAAIPRQPSRQRKGGRATGPAGAAGRKTIEGRFDHQGPGAERAVRFKQSGPRPCSASSGRTAYRFQKSDGRKIFLRLRPGEPIAAHGNRFGELRFGQRRSERPG